MPGIVSALPGATVCTYFPAVSGCRSDFLKSTHSGAGCLPVA